MGLSDVERCAGKWFRGLAELSLAEQLLEFPDSVPCSPRVRFFRHECARQAGRTRSVPLKWAEMLSPETWVAWDGGLRVIVPAEAEELVAAGEAIEFETVLAGKFRYAWRHGMCGKCGLRVMSREGVFSDNRPDSGVQQGDLASFSQGMLLRATSGLKREHT